MIKTQLQSDRQKLNNRLKDFYIYTFHFHTHIAILRNSQLMMFSQASCVFEQYVHNGLADSSVSRSH